jgi:hypothetical protein
LLRGEIDDDTLAWLRAERERHLRILAGVPDAASVDLSLVKLPDGALMFPKPPAPGESFALSALRNPRNSTKEFVRKATALGFSGLRLHDLRGTHETHLLDRGMSPAAVARRCGHGPGHHLAQLCQANKAGGRTCRRDHRHAIQGRVEIGVWVQFGSNPIAMFAFVELYALST